MSIRYHIKSKRAYDSKTGRFISFKRARSSSIFRSDYKLSLYKKPVYEEPVYEEPIYEEPIYKKPVLEWDDLNDIIDAYLEEYDLDELDIGGSP